MLLLQFRFDIHSVLIENKRYFYMVLFVYVPNEYNGQS